MKKILATLLIMLSLQAPLAKAATTGIGQNSSGVSVGAFAITDSFCQNLTTLGAILNSFQIVQWPVSGFPGVVIGLTQRTSVLNDMCTFLTQLESLNGINAIFYAADYLNELTGKKWDESLQLAHSTWDLTNSIYDFDNGGVRPGALTSESNARDMNDWMEQAYHWQGKTFNNEDVNVEHRQQREQDMSSFAQLSYQSATLTDSSKCPSPYDNTNYSQIYLNKVKPVEVKRDYAQEDVDFYHQQLTYMGPRFMQNDKEMKLYVAMLNSMLRDGVYYAYNESDVIKNTTAPSGQRDDNNQSVNVQNKVTVKAYVYSAISDARPFNDFKTRWVSQWSTWVTAQWTSQGSLGALTGQASQNVEAEFKDLNYECNPQRLGQQLDQSLPDFDTKRDLLVKQCRDNTATTEKGSANLLDYYVTQIQQSLYLLKADNAVIWTAESQYAGVNRLIPVKGSASDTTSTFQENGISCSASLEPSEMAKIQIQQQNVNSQLEQMMVKEQIKQTTMQETQEQEVRQVELDQQQHDVMSDSRQTDLGRAVPQTGKPFNVSY